ncbi:proteophosphoglycan ppg4, partial [Moniliophthora roreri]
TVPFPPSFSSVLLLSIPFLVAVSRLALQSRFQCRPPCEEVHQAGICTLFQGSYRNLTNGNCSPSTSNPWSTPLVLGLKIHFPLDFQVRTCIDLSLVVGYQVLHTVFGSFFLMEQLRHRCLPAPRNFTTPMTAYHRRRPCIISDNPQRQRGAMVWPLKRNVVNF